MDRRTGQAHVEQVVIQEVGLGLGVDKDQGTGRWH